MTASPVPEAARRARQRGVTLVELLVAVGLGLVVVLCATAAFVGSKQLFTADAEAQAVEDTLRFAGFVVKGIVRQAGYADYAPDRVDADGAISLPSQVTALDDPSELHVVGARNARVGGKDESYGTHDSRGVNGSDSLLVRFFGRSRANGDATEPDGTMVDCMGFAQPGPMPGKQTSADRAWSFFYVANATDGEPELYCKYRSNENGSFRAEPLARGVEVFNVVYGHDGDGDGVPERWLDAAQLEARAPSAAKAAAEWRKVVGLRFGLVARSARANGWPRGVDEVLYPLGREFPGLGFKPPADGRLRRVATFTVMLRNPLKDAAP
ncbi:MULTISPECIES: PilW family protein [unclassified Variovorax]|uniref:PilW family protein n=1 Tax=unclassified Variovorax TaxID=663243 RepID=UPI003F465E94